LSRIIRYAGLVPRERGRGMDCGFAGFAASQNVDPAIERATLGATAEGSRRASAQLW
jgi:hypothetical protein